MIITLHELKVGLAEDLTSCIRNVGPDLPEVEGLDEPTQDRLRLAWKQAHEAISTIVKIAAAPYYNLELG